MSNTTTEINAGPARKEGRVLPTIWAVVHCLDQRQTIKQAELASEYGFNAMLISMDGNDNMAFLAARKLASALNFETLVGWNPMRTPVLQAFDFTARAGIDALWLDMLSVLDRDELALDCRRTDVDVRVFAPAGFKVGHDPMPNTTARAMAMRGFTPTTSGPGTAIAADPRTVKLMRQALGPRIPLALASGVTPENLCVYLPHVTDILVNTGVSKDFHHFDRKKLSALHDARTGR